VESSRLSSFHFSFSRVTGLSRLLFFSTIFYKTHSHGYRSMQGVLSSLGLMQLTVGSSQVKDLPWSPSRLFRLSGQILLKLQQQSWHLYCFVCHAAFGTRWEFPEVKVNWTLVGWGLQRLIFGENRKIHLFFLSKRNTFYFVRNETCFLFHERGRILTK
jgi:hypothetical protein